MDIRKSLSLRRKAKRRKPGFQRQESGKHAKLKDCWRKPKGRHSKLRQREKARGRHPGKGYGSPAAAKGLGRGGLREIRVSSVSDLSGIAPGKEAAVIASSVGKRKRAMIIEEAKKLKVGVVNAG